MQGQRGRHVEHLVQAHGTRILHCEPEVCRPSRGRVTVHRQSDGRRKQLSAREDRAQARSRASDRGWQQLQAHVQDAGYV